MSHPEEFLCPITQELMDEPVVGKDGHTYERKAIQKWLQQHPLSPISPITREPMTEADLKPNFALKSMLDRYKKDNGIVTTNSGQIRFTNVSTVAPNRDVKVVYNDKAFLVEAVTDKPLETALIMVLDESGSMDSPASRTHESGPTFTRRNLVQHSARVVANMMQKRSNTMLGILGFSTSARMILPTRAMTDMGPANTACDNIRAGGSTMVWDGLRAGLAEAETVAKAYPHMNVQVILLTDGEPSDPVDMILRNLEGRMTTLPTNITLNAFGFGYDLNTDLLDSICRIGKGIYGYIPDISMVGTVFINYCAHILSTSIMNMDIAGHHFHAMSPGTEYIAEHTGHTFTEGEFVDSVKGNNAIAIRMLMDVLKKADPLQMNFTAVKEFCKANTVGSDFLGDLLVDIESDDPNAGQLGKAISSLEWYGSWGKNHIVMYKHALANQMCPNFKENALQHYVRDLFKSFQTMGNELFASLPYPVPSGYTQQQLQTMNFSMTQFNTQDGGCFDGECMVHMMGGTYKKVKDIVKGDVLDNGSVVKCVVRTHVGRVTKMIRFPSGLLITPWHPICTNANTCCPEWQFPCYVNQKLEMIHMEHFYDFVVEGDAQFVTINNWEVACLGHGMTDNEVISHPYYGTDAVLEILKDKEGWEKGFVEI